MSSWHDTESSGDYSGEGEWFNAKISNTDSILQTAWRYDFTFWQVCDFLFFFFFVAHYALSFPRWYFSPLDPCNPVLSLAAYLWLWPHLCSLVNLNYSKVPWPFFFALSQSHMHNFWTTSKKGFWFMRKVTAYPSSINADVDPRGGTDTCVLPMVLNLLPCSQSSQYYRSIII